MAAPSKPTPKPPTTTGKTAITGLMAKYGSKLDQAVKEHAQDETKYGFTRIPPGINNGIAHLKECYFAEYKTGELKGEYYCRMMGIVISPKLVNVQGTQVPAAGCQTSLMFPCCDTKGKDENGAETTTPQSEHIARILNMMRCLGGEEFTHNSTGADLERLAKQLEDARPFFKFSTSPKKDMKTGQVDYNLPPWENWQGSKGLENYIPPEGGGVNDNSGIPDDKTVNVDTVSTQPTTSGVVPPTTPPTTTATAEYSDSGDLDSLLNAAKADGKEATDAQNKLTDMAVAAGHDKATVEATNSWEEVIELIKGSTSAEQPWQPEKGGVYGYVPIDGKTKKPGTKTNVEVIEVYAEMQAVDLRRVDNPKIAYRGIEWSKLDVAD